MNWIDRPISMVLAVLAAAGVAVLIRGGIWSGALGLADLAGMWVFTLWVLVARPVFTTWNAVLLFALAVVAVLSLPAVLVDDFLPVTLLRLAGVAVIVGAWWEVGTIRTPWVFSALTVPPVVVGANWVLQLDWLIVAAVGFFALSVGGTLFGINRDRISVGPAVLFLSLVGLGIGLVIALEISAEAELIEPQQ